MPRRSKVQEEEVYHVEVITKARVSEESEWEYLVKWAGYGSESDSWEPTENVKQCDRLLASFWKHVGTDDNDYPIGYEIAAAEDWINKEKRYFRETFVKSSKRKSDKATKKVRQERLRTSHMSESTADNSDSSEESSARISGAKRLNRKARVVDTESESKSDSHSPKQAKAAFRPKAITVPSMGIPKVSTQGKRQDLPSTTGGPTSMAPLRTVVRTHQDQKANPLVKPMNLPSASVEAGSSLSTKQRVAAGIPPLPTGPKPLPTIPKKSLQALSFKKSKPAIPLVSQTKDAITSSTSVATPTSSGVQTPMITNDPKVVASPEPMDVDHPGDLWDSIPDAGPPGGSSHPLTAIIPSKSQKEIDAEKFLQTVPIAVSSDLLEPAVISDQPAQLTTELLRTLAISKIPKKWKWTGDLFISTSESKTELLCAVTIADPSGTSNTSHINLLLSSLDSLCISKLHSIMDLSPILRACGKPQYFGILESSEEVIIHGLECHLTNEGLAAAIPLLLDATEVAILIIFPGAQQRLTKALQVPEYLSTGTHLLVVLLPFLVPTTTPTRVAGQRSIETVMQLPLNPQDVLVPSEPPHEAMLYQAMSLLCFPKALLDFLNSASTRTYCIWPSTNQVSPGLDILMLQFILKSTKAMAAKLEEDVRVVFISNQHLEILHTMPSLATKLVNCPETQFWTFGYSPSMIPQRWKIQEIYPLGGVVTFTPSALAEDLVGCCQLMSQIIEHPLWDCYLIPEVLAVGHLLCSDGGLGSLSETHLGPILDFINLGLISVIRMPPKGHSNQAAWLLQVFKHSNASGSALLEAYLGILRSYPNTLDMTTEQLIIFTNDEITKDFSSAQIHPAFMESYRRFVVIRAASEGTIPLDKDGLEWSTLSMFSFKDDYFQS